VKIGENRQNGRSNQVGDEQSHVDQDEEEREEPESDVLGSIL
jgi:hypothetical protein